MSDIQMEVVGKGLGPRGTTSIVLQKEFPDYYDPLEDIDIGVP